MSDDRIHILCTGEIPGFAGLNKYSDRIDFDIIPFSQTRFIRDEETTGRISRLSTTQAVVVFTSAKAVEALHMMPDKKERAWKIYCIGYATKTAVLKYFKEEDIVATASNAMELAEIIIRNRNFAVTFFCGDLRRDDLPKKLTENAIAVEELIVYQTVYTPVQIEKKYSGVLFFSPGAVESFFSLNTRLTDATFFAIGKTTASAIEKYSDKEIIISNTPDKLDLAYKAISYFQEKINR